MANRLMHSHQITAILLGALVFRSDNPPGLGTCHRIYLGAVVGAVGAVTGGAGRPCRVSPVPTPALAAPGLTRAR